MIAAFALVAVGTTLVPLATNASMVAVALLVAQQLVSDPAATVYDINQVSLRQAITPDRLQGRVNASMRVLEVGATLAGSLVGGALGETIGIRATFASGIIVLLLGAVVLVLSPVRRLTAIPSITPQEDMAGPERSTWEAREVEV